MKRKARKVKQPEPSPEPSPRPLLLADLGLDPEDMKELRRYLDPEENPLLLRELKRVETAFSRLSRKNQEVLLATHGERWPARKSAQFPGLDSFALPVRLLALVASRSNVSELTLRRWALLPDEHAAKVRDLRFRTCLALAGAHLAYRQQLALLPRKVWRDDG